MSLAYFTICATAACLASGFLHSFVSTSVRYPLALMKRRSAAPGSDGSSGKWAAGCEYGFDLVDKSNKDG